VPDVLVEPAPAKVNLSLRVLGRRVDGYHNLESLVVFARAGDRLTLTPGPDLALEVEGPTATAAGDAADNLVLRAANALAARTRGLRVGRFALAKHLPVAAGLGGGSSDAAAALRLLARLNRLDPNDARLLDAARVTGADVPVCLDPRPRLMRGIGEILSPPFDVPALPAVLVNPGVPLPTKDVFAKLGLRAGQQIARANEVDVEKLTDTNDLIAYLATQSNDLEPAAISLQPVIAEVLSVMAREEGCLLARMSGSGATCFGLFRSDAAARAAVGHLMSIGMDWWVSATVFGAAPPAA